MATSKSKRLWTVVDAQVNLLEMVRLAKTEGPQYIGAEQTFVVMPAKTVQAGWAAVRQWFEEKLPVTPKECQEA